ncbi:MAG: peptide chain release factor 3 [Gemmatimonadaceae bacterium]|nr:peptide chain release factor 3 [Gemmatimonadaceae bacterium]NUQ91732.1 peptide chain release factor 3 [Gemmatimonadaceae bacterium]NUR19359.1 peptide chain release factor 3 [Gemmatimonadaceae bacterium]NUS98785.1 peptide chain release factor 3 [Gemmatimonadaceae bacterium]
MSEAAIQPDLAEAIRKRRTFAIISHPDAGKTTLTEKLLLYGGAIHLAGSVKGRRAARHATSDWMKLEQERGISVTSSVMQFEYAGYHVNLLDTPGHEDFSEDTYRTLVAADSAVMLLDNRRGVEERTRQLFAVCKRRRTPIFTFVNKCDRVGEDPLKLISDVEADLGIMCHAVTWPIRRDDAFIGVYDRRQKKIHLFDRDEAHGAERVRDHVAALDAPETRELLGDATHDALLHDLELLDAAGHPFDERQIREGELSPVFFGSALTNFGVEPFLAEFLELAPEPLPRESSVGPIDPYDDAFTGFVFKIQANMDPKHRDRVAFVRVCSGKFEAGMDVKQTRTGKTIRLSAPQQFLARERTAIEEAYPGDVIGVMDRGNLRIGDTLSEREGVEFQGIPRFAPEHFTRVVLIDPMKRKQLDAGLRQLTEEGAAQVFFTSPSDVAGPTPIVGAVGQLQFDVMLHRLEHEYGVRCRLERMAGKSPRWVTGPEDEIERVARSAGRSLIYDVKGNPVVLFTDAWDLRWATEKEKAVQWFEVAP